MIVCMEKILKVRLAMEGRIFISYSRKDIDGVMDIEKELESIGFRCWMDVKGGIESG